MRSTDEKTVWFVTDARRGMSADIAKAALEVEPFGIRTTIVNQERPPRRFIAGADAIGTAEQVVATLQQEIAAFRDLSTSLALDEASPCAS